MSDIPKGQAASIFVSYRIKDTLHTADRLAVELRRVFGQDQVFFDRRTIEPGETWDNRIEGAVKRAKVVLVLIGKKWLTVQDEYGRRRIDIPTDWVRREVEEALTIKDRVVPVLVDDASPVPAAALVDLPNMVKLASCHGAKMRTEDWDSDFNALVNLLKSKGLLVLAQQDDSGQNVDRARQAEQLISSYQLAIQQRWQELWSGDGTSNKPPFIDTQGLRLLLETNRPEQRHFLGVDQRGKNRLEWILQEALEILSTPRDLSYLRVLPDADLSKIPAAGDVYWQSCDTFDN